jgi:flagellar hook-length control protein FliK
MNLSALPELLLSWIKNQGTALLQGEKSQAAQFQPGQQYEGKVVDNLSNGRHLVKIGTQMLDMNLAAKMQPGDTVRLTYLNAGPRPTFLLNQSPVTPAQQVQISNTAQQVNALLRLAQVPASGPSGVVNTTAQATIAPAGFPATLAQPAISRGAVTGAESMAPAPRTTASAVASATQSTIATQVAPAAQTARPIAANVLMLQNFNASVQPMTTTLTGPITGLLGQAVDAPRAAISASTTLSANTLVELPSQSRHMLPVRLSQTLSESGLFYESHLARWSRGALSLESILREPQARLAQDGPAMVRLADLGGMPEEAARLAGRQLQMLEGGPFYWQGLAWPGQTMQWLVREDAAEGREQTGEKAAAWVTELKMALPELGAVHAQLDLKGDSLRLRLLAESGASREKLSAASPMLIKGLELNGLRVADLLVDALRSGRDDDG